MALYYTWILVLMVVKLFSESTCTLSVRPVCGDLSLQYFFFLVPPSSELQSLKKFLASIESATIFDTPEDGKMVQVICDPKDREKIYGYTKDRDIYFIHSTYCVEKSQLSALQEVRLRRNKLRKLMMNEAPDNLLDKETGRGKIIAMGKDSLKELNGEVLKVLKNGRILKTRAIRYMAKKKGNKNRSMKTTKKDENCTPSSTKSIKKQTSTGRVKTNPRRSVNTETESSTWIENTLQRMKRYSWDILTKNYHGENGHDNGNISTNRRKIRGLTTPSGIKGTSSKLHRPEPDNGISTVPSSGDSDSTESTGATDGISTTTTDVISEILTTDTIEESTDEIMPAGEEGTRSKNRGSRDIISLELEIERKLVKRSEFSSTTHKHGTTEESSAKNDHSENDDI